LIWASFKVNQEFIAKTLCINRDKPEMQCKGKCHLTKKIAEDKEESPQKIPLSQPDEQKQVLAFNEILHFEIKFTKPVPAKLRLTEKFFTPQVCVTDIFQPPRIMI
jgi:hypothetical protein